MFWVNYITHAFHFRIAEAALQNVWYKEGALGLIELWPVKTNTSQKTDKHNPRVEITSGDAASVSYRMA